MIVSFTPIRSGSKGLPHKNIRLLNGKPLFHFVVLEAQKVSSVNEVWISTDSEHYASLAPPGVKVHMRSKESASDKAATVEVVMEFAKIRPDVATIVILQATSPTTTSYDIEDALRHSKSGKGCVSVQKAPAHLYQDNKPLWTKRVRRQDSNIFAEDGSIYVVHVADFVKTKSIPTLPCHTLVIQHPVCDIDTERDFKYASDLLYMYSRFTVQDNDRMEHFYSYLGRCDDLPIPARQRFYKKRTMIIANIGTNYQGDINMVKEIIRGCKNSGVDVVQFARQDLGQDGRFTPKSLQSPHISNSSLEKTYGEHQGGFELFKDNFITLKSYAKSVDILFVGSGHDKPSFDFLETLDVPFYEIDSDDIYNLELIEHVAKKGKPVILSIGTSDLTTVEQSVSAVCKHNHNLTLLHCLSIDPIEEDETQLNSIRTYQRMFPGINIGIFYGNDTETTLALAAVALGCVIVYITSDILMKGSDHNDSLDLTEIVKLVRDIRRFDTTMGAGIKYN